jgi:predicted 3-demethylubiquinone-9 3-methyltransferase (glyoxalase superfamily)
MKIMSGQKIVPHLWFDKEAQEAAQFYVSTFGKNSKLRSRTVLHNTPSGDADIVFFELWGYELMSISAGPLFKFNPSISFMVNFDPSQDKDARKSIDEIWAKLSDGGKVLMPLDKYPFSERYGWVEDKYGLSWQLIYTNPEGEERPLIIPSLLFVGKAYGKAESAMDFYTSVFKNSKKGEIARYPAGMEPEKEGKVMFSEFKLEDQWMTAMDSAKMHDFEFNEAISFIVNCEDQKEIDYFWEKLSAVPASEQCGWLKDKFGVSWQIQPTEMNQMMSSGTQEQIDRVTQAFLPMKKLDLAKLKQAYEGR